MTDAELAERLIEDGAYAAIGTVDCSPDNAAKAARVIREFITGELHHSGFVVVRKPTQET